MRQALLNRFLRYVQQDTQANPDSVAVPSSAGQVAFAKQLQQELLELGFDDVFLSESCCLYAKIAANTAKVPAIGFLAHLDTAADYSGAGVKPRVIDKYQGQVIPLEQGEELNPEQFPSLLNTSTKLLSRPMAPRYWVPMTRPVSPRSLRRCIIYCNTRKFPMERSISVLLPMKRLAVAQMAWSSSASVPIGPIRSMAAR